MLSVPIANDVRAAANIRLAPAAPNHSTEARAGMRCAILALILTGAARRKNVSKRVTRPASTQPTAGLRVMRKQLTK